MGDTKSFDEADFLSTSKSFFNGELTAKEAATALGNQLHGMRSDGTWGEALSKMQDQNNKLDTLPRVDCTYMGTELYSCIVSSSLLDSANVKDQRTIKILDHHNHNNVEIYLGHFDEPDSRVDQNRYFNESKFKVDATAEDPVVPKMTTALPFSDHPDMVFPNRSVPLTDFPTGSTTEVNEVGDLIKKVKLGTPQENAKVENLMLNGAGMPGSVLGLLDQFPNMKSLFVGCNATDEDLAYLSTSRNLESIVIGDGVYQMNGPGLKHISQLPKLNKLDLSTTYLGSGDLQNLTSPSLEQLRLGMGVENEGFKHLAKLPNLKVLQLDRGYYSPEGLKQLAESKSLQHLVLNLPFNVWPDDLDKVRKSLPGVKVDYVKFGGT